MDCPGQLYPLKVLVPPACVRSLAPGEAKRVLARGDLLGYYVACPACGHVGTHLGERAGFVERDGRLVGSNWFVCYRCRRGIRVVEQDGQASLEVHG